MCVHIYLNCSKFAQFVFYSGCRETGSEDCPNKGVIDKFKEKSLLYQIPDVPDVDLDNLNEEVKEFLSANSKPKKKMTRARANDSVTDSTSFESQDISSSRVNSNTDDSSLDKNNSSEQTVTISNDTSAKVMKRSADDVTTNPTKKPKTNGDTVSNDTNLRRYPTRSRSNGTPSPDVQIVSQRKAHLKQVEFENPAQFTNALLLPKKSRPPAEFLHLTPPMDHNYSVWQSVTSDLKQCTRSKSTALTFADMKTVCSTYCDNVGLDRIVSLYNVRLDWDNQDVIAHSLWPRDGPFDRSEAFEITTEAVGDCLSAAISRLVYGNQYHTREIRTRMTVEGVLFHDWYLDNENLGLDLPILHTEKSLKEKYKLYSGTHQNDTSMCYMAEVVRCFQSNAECALWQLHHMSTVIGRPIISIFPEFDDVEDEAPLRFYHNRTILPRLEEDRENEAVIIMWTKASPLSGDLVNHFVPVVRSVLFLPLIKLLSCCFWLVILFLC